MSVESNSRESRWATWMRAAIDGDAVAYRLFLESVTPFLRTVATRRCVQYGLARYEAEDVVQDAWLRGYRKLESFEYRSDFGTWIYRIAVRCALDKMSASKVDESTRIGETTDREHDELQIADQEADPERLLLSGEIRAMQEIAMHGLSPIERTAFVLRHLEDCTTEEIATTMSIPTNTAKQSVFRAVQKLRRRLATLKVKI